MSAGGKPMDNSLTLEPTTEETTQFRQRFTQGLAEMDRLFELVASDQKEIDRLSNSTQITLAEIRAISKSTDAILATLKSV
jgi:hypothetical protein